MNVIRIERVGVIESTHETVEVLIEFFLKNVALLGVEGVLS